MTSPTIIYCDGACPGNGTSGALAGGWAAVLDANTHHSDGQRSDGMTNQRAEILAAYAALQLARANNLTGDIVIRTDSQYVAKTMSGDFRRKSNLDLWEMVDSEIALLTSDSEMARTSVRVRFEWVRGHNGDPLQELADKLAVKAARTAPVGPRPLTVQTPNQTEPDAYNRRAAAAINAAIPMLEKRFLALTAIKPTVAPGQWEPWPLESPDGTDASLLLRQRNTLGRAIHDAAVKAGIARDDVAPNGPTLLMLVNDMAEEIIRLRAASAGT